MSNAPEGTLPLSEMAKLVESEIRNGADCASRLEELVRWIGTHNWRLSGCCYKRNDRKICAGIASMCRTTKRQYFIAIDPKCSLFAIELRVGVDPQVTDIDLFKTVFENQSLKNFATWRAKGDDLNAVPLTTLQNWVQSAFDHRASET